LRKKLDIWCFSVEKKVNLTDFVPKWWKKIVIADKNCFYRQKLLLPGRFSRWKEPLFVPSGKTCQP